MSKHPDFTVYHVTERGEGQDKKAFWTKIGAAWSHDDGEGFNLSLEYMPMTAGRMVIRSRKEKPENAEEGGE